jgi:RNA polymerase sigma-70 factor, ECF subfamily
MPSSTSQVSALLINWGLGDQAAREALIPLVYDELRRLARRYLWRERADHTLESAALGLDRNPTRLISSDA